MIELLSVIVEHLICDDGVLSEADGHSYLYGATRAGDMGYIFPLITEATLRLRRITKGGSN